MWAVKILIILKAYLLDTNPCTLLCVAWWYCLFAFGCSWCCVLVLRIGVAYCVVLVSLCGSLLSGESVVYSAHCIGVVLQEVLRCASEEYYTGIVLRLLRVRALSCVLRLCADNIFLVINFLKFLTNKYVSSQFSLKVCDYITFYCMLVSIISHAYKHIIPHYSH